MEHFDFHYLIMKGIYHLNALTNLDVIWFDHERQKVHGIQSLNTPDILEFNADKEYPIIDGLCRNGPNLCYCAATTSSFLEFVFIPLILGNDNLGLIRIGPFLSAPLTEEQLSSFIVSLSLPPSRSLDLRNYYESIPMHHIEVAKNLGHIGFNLFGYNMPFTYECLYHSEGIDTDSLTLYERSVDTDTILIEQRYEFEHQISKAVENGDRKALDKLMEGSSKSDVIDNLMSRFPENPLRSAKNLAIVVNTVLRHAAEKGGLNPVYLHQISTKYALLIEDAKTKIAVQKLQFDMPYAYADMVKAYAFPNTSPFIQKILDYILLNLNAPLSLSALADHFGIEPSNLAKQFKNGTGQTVTDFINTRRINEACHYLKKSELPISEISQYVGINDTNYFSRLFKKQMGMSPLQYRKGFQNPMK